MNARMVVKLIQADGWYEARVTGSHHQFRHATKPGLVTVPVHGNKDLKLGVLRSVERQSGVKLRKE